MGLDGSGAVDVACGVQYELLTKDFADNGRGIVKFEFACAMDRAVQFTFAKKIMAFNGYAADNCVLVDVYIAAGLYAFVPFGFDFIVAQVDVGPAMDAMGFFDALGHGLCLLATVAGDDFRACEILRGFSQQLRGNRRSLIFAGSLPWQIARPWRNKNRSFDVWPTRFLLCGGS